MSCPMLCKPSINISCLKCELGSTSILGNGASGTTYKAFEGVFGEVAAKVLTLAHDVNKKGAKEIDLLSQVPANSFLVQLHGWCWSNPGNAQYPVILMEYMHGGSLHDILYNEPSLELPPSFKNRLMKEFADALRFLHSKSFNKHPIVHCDLKPQNLLLTMEMHLKISDLGSAFRCSTVELRLKGGEEQSLYISNRYCAPELFISNLNELPSPEVDIYSAAIILWEAMVREEPYKYVINDEFIKQAVLANNRPKLDEAFLTKKGLSAEQTASLKAVCPQAWDATPSKRPNAEGFVQLIETHFPFSQEQAFREASKIAITLLSKNPLSTRTATEPLSKLIKQNMEMLSSNNPSQCSVSVQPTSHSAEENETIPKLIDDDDDCAAFVTKPKEFYISSDTDFSINNHAGIQASPEDQSAESTIQNENQNVKKFCDLDGNGGRKVSLDLKSNDIYYHIIRKHDGEQGAVSRPDVLVDSSYPVKEAPRTNFYCSMHPRTTRSQPTMPVSPATSFSPVCVDCTLQKMFQPSGQFNSNSDISFSPPRRVVFDQDTAAVNSSRWDGFPDRQRPRSHSIEYRHPYSFPTSPILTPPNQTKERHVLNFSHVLNHRRGRPVVQSSNRNREQRAMSDSRDNLCRQSTPFYSGSFHTSSTGDSIYASNVAMNEGDGGLNGYRHGYAEPIYENYSSLPRRLPMHLQRGAPLNNTFHGAYPSYMYEDNHMRPQQNNQMRPQQDAPVYENLVPNTEKLPQILILGAKKVGKHSFCNLHKRITFRKKIKGEPYKEFNIHNEKNYLFASSIDVVILCFASDIKKSLTEVESTWKRVQLNLSGVPVLVVMTRAEKQKVSNDKMYRRGKQYSGSIGAKFCSISSDNESDVERVFDLAYKEAMKRTRRWDIQV